MALIFLRPTNCACAARPAPVTLEHLLLVSWPPPHGAAPSQTGQARPPLGAAAFAVAAALKAPRVAPPCQASGVSEMSPPPSGFPRSPYLSCSPAPYTALFFSSAPTPPAQEARRADVLFPSLLPWEFVMVGVAVRSLVPGLLQKQVIHKYWWNEQIRTGRPRAPGEPPHRASQAAWSGSGPQRRLRAEEPPSSGWEERNGPRACLLG